MRLFCASLRPRKATSTPAMYDHNT